MDSQPLVLLILLILSGFFSSAETALFSISRVRARHLAKSPHAADKLIHKMKEDPHRLLTTILIGNNLVNIAAAALATAIAIDFFENRAVAFATIIMTILILVFGEILPKSVATRNNLMLARFAIFPIYWLSIIFYPVVIVLDFIPRITGKIKKTPSVTEEELKTFVEVVEEEGEIKEEEKEFIHNIIEFDDTNASEIMTPRGDMFIVDVDEELDLKKLLESGYTRFPVIEGGLDKVVGIINIKDVFMHQTTCEQAVAVRKIMAKPYFVPENKKLDTLLRQFKRRKQHIAIVVDEHGGIAGLITLEDVLEEIVGEIRDETDHEEPLVVRLKKNEWRVLGKTEIEDVNETLGLSIPESKDYDTFSGYILDRIGRIPDLGDRIATDELEVTVKKVDGNRIQEYHVRKKESLPQES
jgi:CBS domain containing-hemolysin-like protein